MPVTRNTRSSKRPLHSPSKHPHESPVKDLNTHDTYDENVTESSYQNNLRSRGDSLSIDNHSARNQKDDKSKANLEGSSTRHGANDHISIESINEVSKSNSISSDKNLYGKTQLSSPKRYTSTDDVPVYPRRSPRTKSDPSAKSSPSLVDKSNISLNIEAISAKPTSETLSKMKSHTGVSSDVKLLMKSRNNKGYTSETKHSPLPDIISAKFEVTKLSSPLETKQDVLRQRKSPRIQTGSLPNLETSQVKHEISPPKKYVAKLEPKSSQLELKSPPKQKQQVAPQRKSPRFKHDNLPSDTSKSHILPALPLEPLTDNLLQQRTRTALSEGVLGILPKTKLNTPIKDKNPVHILKRRSPRFKPQSSDQCQSAVQQVFESDYVDPSSGDINIRSARISTKEQTTASSTVTDCSSSGPNSNSLSSSNLHSANRVAVPPSTKNNPVTVVNPTRRSPRIKIESLASLISVHKIPISNAAIKTKDYVPPLRKSPRQAVKIIPNVTMYSSVTGEQGITNKYTLIKLPNDQTSNEVSDKEVAKGKSQPSRSFSYEKSSDSSSEQNSLLKLVSGKQTDRTSHHDVNCTTVCNTDEKESKRNVRRKIAFMQKQSKEKRPSENDDSDDEYIPRRKKLRSEVSESELWEGFPQNIRFKRLTPKKQAPKIEEVVVKSEPVEYTSDTQYSEADDLIDMEPNGAGVKENTVDITNELQYSRSRTNDAFDTSRENQMTQLCIENNKLCESANVANEFVIENNDVTDRVKKNSSVHNKPEKIDTLNDITGKTSDAYNENEQVNNSENVTDMTSGKPDMTSCKLNKVCDNEIKLSCNGTDISSVIKGDKETDCDKFVCFKLDVYSCDGNEPLQQDKIDVNSRTTNETINVRKDSNERKKMSKCNQDSVAENNEMKGSENLSSGTIDQHKETKHTESNKLKSFKNGSTVTENRENIPLEVKNDKVDISSKNTKNSYNEVTPKRSVRLQNRASSAKKKDDVYVYTPLKRHDNEEILLNLDCVQNNREKSESNNNVLFANQDKTENNSGSDDVNDLQGDGLVISGQKETDGTSLKEGSNRDKVESKADDEDKRNKRTECETQSIQKISYSTFERSTVDAGNIFDKISKLENGGEFKPASDTTENSCADDGECRETTTGEKQMKESSACENVDKTNGIDFNHKSKNSGKTSNEADYGAVSTASTSNDYKARKTKDEDGSSSDDNGDSETLSTDTETLPRKPLKIKMKKTRKGAAIIYPKSKNSPYVLLPRINVQQCSKTKDSLDEAEPKIGTGVVRSSKGKEKNQNVSKNKKAKNKYKMNRQLRSSEEYDEISLEMSELGEKSRKSGKIFKQKRKRKSDERSPLKKKSKRRVSSPRKGYDSTRSKTGDVNLLLANKTLENHACILWSSGHRRHFQMSHPDSSHAEIDDIMRNAWEKMTPKEKLGYFQRAHNAMRDEDKHSTPIKESKCGIQTPEIKHSKKMSKFISLSPNEQHEELQKWLRLFYEISASEYSKLMLDFKELLKVKRAEMKEKCKGNFKEKDAEAESYYRKLLFQKILDARDKIIEIYEQKKERQKLILKEAYDSTVRRLIAGEDLEFSKGTHSEALESVLLDLRELEGDLKVAVSGTPIATKSFKNVLDGIQQETETVTSNATDNKKTSDDGNELNDADSSFAQQLLCQSSSATELPRLEADSVDAILENEPQQDAQSYNDELSREVFKELSKFFDREVRTTHERLTRIGSVASCCDLNSPSCTMTNWLLADQFRALSRPMNPNQLAGNNNRMLIDSKQLVQFLKGTGPYNVVALPASTIPPNIRRSGVRRGRPPDVIGNRNNNSSILDRQQLRPTIRQISVEERQNIQSIIQRRIPSIPGHTVLRYTSTSNGGIRVHAAPTV